MFLETFSIFASDRFEIKKGYIQGARSGGKNFSVGKVFLTNLSFLL